MEPNQPMTSTTSYSVPPPQRGMFGTKVPTSVAFVVGILVFLLPFSEIRCGGTKLATKSGLDYALGNDWKPVAGGFGGEELKSKTTSTGKEQEGNTRYFIFGALGLGALGLILSMGGAKAGGGGALATGLLAGGALIGFMLDLKKNFANSMREQAMDKASEGAESVGLDNISNTMSDMKPELAFTPWFYIAVAAFILAAIFGLMRMRSSRS